MSFAAFKPCRTAMKKTEIVRAVGNDGEDMTDDPVSCET